MSKKLITLSIIIKCACTLLFIITHVFFFIIFLSNTICKDYDRVLLLVKVREDYREIIRIKLTLETLFRVKLLIKISDAVSARVILIRVTNF